MKTDELFAAIRQNDAAAVAALLDEDRALLEATSHEITPILFSIYHGHPELAELFIERGAPLGPAELAALGDRRVLDADLDQFSRDGFPLLGLAIFFHHPELAAEMIERGADVNARARNQAGVAPLHSAVSVGDFATARLLLENGAEVNARQQLGYTPLHGAAGNGDAAMTDLLLLHGADATAKNEQGKTAADLADERGHAELAAHLRVIIKSCEPSP
jgi:ankyrin repeat protein